MFTFKTPFSFEICCFVTDINLMQCFRYGFFTCTNSFWAVFFSWIRIRIFRDQIRIFGRSGSGLRKKSPIQIRTKGPGSGRKVPDPDARSRIRNTSLMLNKRCPSLPTIQYTYYHSPHSCPSLFPLDWAEHSITCQDGLNFTLRIYCTQYRHCRLQHQRAFSGWQTNFALWRAVSTAISRLYTWSPLS